MRTQQDVEAALGYAYEHIKPNDVVCVGMWQKHLDYVQANAAYVSALLRQGNSVTLQGEPRLAKARQ